MAWWWIEETPQQVKLMLHDLEDRYPGLCKALPKTNRTTKKSINEFKYESKKEMKECGHIYKP